MGILFVLIGLLIIISVSIRWWYRTKDLGPDDEVELLFDKRQDRETYGAMQILSIFIGLIVLFYGLIL